MRCIAVIVAALVLLSGCADRAARAPDQARAPQVPRVEPVDKFIETVLNGVAYVEYTPGTMMAVVSTDTASPTPCVVILHGHDVGIEFYQPLARAVAEEGASVFLPDWDDTLPSAEDSRTQTVTDGLDDVADALRFIHLYARRYGGDPRRVVIVGHSLGAAAAMTAMLAGDRFGTDAFPHEVSALPDAYVSLDGVVPFRELLWNEELRRLYGQDPTTWDKINPDTYLDKAPPRRDAEFRFFVATLDFDATNSMAARMRKLGYNTSFEKIDVGHMQAAEPQPETVKAIAELAHPD